jgi:predicted CXXCH cytochrome family protein
MMTKIKLLAVLITVILLLYRCSNKTTPQAGTAVYVGSDKCMSCHQKEAALFKTSDHYHAMDTVSAATVRGNFNNAQFIYHGDTAFFYQRGAQYFVKTTDSTGVKKEFLVRYTFGWQPLQQYLVQFEDGRMQVLPFCWDTREKEKGGQRWFHLYNNEKIAHTDELFWMGINQNWNYMCADCHTTDFYRNFDYATNKFNSTWKESRVSCESCHGPASAHMEWSENKSSNLLYKGFPISLKGKPLNWKMDPALQTLQPETVIKNDTLIETCARCHARATRFSDEYKHGQSFLQSHIPATADPVNYHIDGQIKEENYEYASFLQSKMYAKGVTCTNCHEPHSMKVLNTGNALCTSCHTPAKYDGPQHSFHKATSTGNQCVTCHMPVTTYMVVDNRLDHSIRIPRPDQSLAMGTPNACNKCHTDKPVQWAAESFTKWYGNKLPKEKTYAELMHAVSRYIRESEPSLYELLQQKNYPAIIRSTAMEQYGYYTTSRVSTILFDELKSEESMIRLNALRAIRNYPEETVLGHARPLLYDKVAAVRHEAMNALAPFYTKLGTDEGKQFNKVRDEYLVVQEKMSHRPEGIFNRALLKNTTGNSKEAEQLYRDCISRFPNFIQAYNNLADLYREQGREAEVKQVIDRGLQKNSGSAYLHYAMGLWFIRNKENKQGAASIKTAALTEPSNAQFVYGYAISLFSAGKQAEALQLLEKTREKYGNQLMILEGLISICQDMGQADKLARYSAIRKEVFNY